MTRGLHRGSVWLAALPPPIGTRPVVVVTRDVAIPSLTSVTVVQVTSSVRGVPSELPMGPQEGLHHDSVANCDNIYTIRKSQLSKWLGALGPDKLADLAKTIRIALDL